MRKSLVRRVERGNAAVELALLMPVLIVILCGAIDFSRAFFAYVTVSSTAHEAARYAARQPGARVTPAALQTVVAGESRGFVQIGSANGGNASLTGPSLEGTDEQVAKVTLTYQFQPLTPLPVAGPVAIAASASAPTGGAGGAPTTTPVVSPTPSSTPSPTATIALCPVPSLIGYPLNGNTARDIWTGAGFSASNFNKDENTGTVLWQTLTASPPGPSLPCSSASITVHNHVP